MPAKSPGRGKAVTHAAHGDELVFRPVASEHLADLEQRDIAVATDWRDVVAGIATRHLGLPEKRLGEIFPGFVPSGKTISVVG